MRKILHIKCLVGFFVLCFFCTIVLPAFAINNNVVQFPNYTSSYSENQIAQFMDSYKSTSKDESICIALELMKETKGYYSRQVILGDNPTNKPIKIIFKDLSSINPAYGNADALGMKKGSQIYIYINEKNRNAPVIALAALLAHEALHQDKFNSLSEETYAWTTEAIVWGELAGKYPQYQNSLSTLACREKTLYLLYQKGGETSKYIKQIVYSSPSYENLPETSPGFSVL